MIFMIMGLTGLFCENPSQKQDRLILSIIKTCKFYRKRLLDLGVDATQIQFYNFDLRK
jgi:hypothetical protein